MNPAPDIETTENEIEAQMPWSRVVAVVLGITTLLALVLIAFAWPNISSEPRSVPVVVAGPEQAVTMLDQGLAEALGEDALDLETVADADAAEGAILDREAYGAIILGSAGGELLTASAASPAVAQVLQQIAAVVPEETGGPLPMRDVVPLPGDDPRGVGLTSAVLPLVMGGIIAGAVSSLLLCTRGRQLVTVLGIAGAGALVFTGILQGWMGSLAGSYWANAAVLALGISAIALSMVGLFRLLGRPGIVLVVLTMMLLGNPLSGAGSAPEMLPAGWGEFGQLLPPGATVTALRSVAFFDGAGSGLAWTVLGAWGVVGLCLILFTRNRQNSVSAPER
ncbi:hypothetical protein [Nesterenkonia ebinurensis]|uniref:hypothetical protein n=1 Tax=Nesterenkonia ebinurensis TaxID=2608252 RepID=UPI001CC74E15|nr:hypothetical protein [Nesterenkonia ebinurensis]